MNTKPKFSVGDLVQPKCLATLKRDPKAREHFEGASFYGISLDHYKADSKNVYRVKAVGQGLDYSYILEMSLFNWPEVALKKVRKFK